jgi:leucyl/phenylalanyl-tRNA--protein transferase
VEVQTLVATKTRETQLVEPRIVHHLAERWRFPHPGEAAPEGLVAYGGDLSAGRLLAAYAQGLFPWYDEPPILWFSPDPRTVFRPDGIRVNRTLAKNIRRGRYTIHFDRAFRQVIEACAQIPRAGQSGTWINEDMIEAYCALHAMGYAHSVEAWRDETLVGGVYGVSLGAAFFGESMFAREADASKVALVALARHVHALGFHFIDAQAPTPQTTALGATSWPREVFLDALKTALERPTICGPWSPLDVESFSHAAKGQRADDGAI